MLEVLSYIAVLTRLPMTLILFNIHPCQIREFAKPHTIRFLTNILAYFLARCSGIILWAEIVSALMSFAYCAFISPLSHNYIMLCASCSID